MIMVSSSRAKQQDTRCLRVKELRSGRMIHDSHRCESVISTRARSWKSWSKVKASTLVVAGQTRSISPSSLSRANHLSKMKLYLEIETGKGQCKKSIVISKWCLKRRMNDKLSSNCSE